MLVQMFIVLMFQTCAQYSLELWKLARYNGITMLPFGRAIADHGSPFDALRDNLLEIGVFTDLLNSDEDLTSYNMYTKFSWCSHFLS